MTDISGKQYNDLARGSGMTKKQKRGKATAVDFRKIENAVRQWLLAVG